MAKIVAYSNEFVEIQDRDKLYRVSIELLDFEPVVGYRVSVIRRADNSISKVIFKGGVEEESIIPIVMGILSIVFVVLNFIGIPFLHLFGIVFSIIGFTFNAKEEGSKYHATAGILNLLGLVLGIVSMIIGALMWS